MVREACMAITCCESRTSDLYECCSERNEFFFFCVQTLDLKMGKVFLQTKFPPELNCKVKNGCFITEFSQKKVTFFFCFSFPFLWWRNMRRVSLSKELSLVIFLISCLLLTRLYLQSQSLSFSIHYLFPWCEQDEGNKNKINYTSREKKKESTLSLWENNFT